MSSFVRELYESDISEINKKYAFSEDADVEFQTREKVYKNIEEVIGKEKSYLLEDYVNADKIVRDEEFFHAYVSGMKDLLRLLISVFDEQ